MLCSLQQMAYATDVLGTLLLVSRASCCPGCMMRMLAAGTAEHSAAPWLHNDAHDSYRVSCCSGCMMCMLLSLGEPSCGAAICYPGGM